MTLADTAPAADRELLATHTTRLLETISRLDDASGPSLCEGWTRGHVISHVARNAEAIVRLASWAVTGDRQEMYPGGAGARDAAIEEGAGRAVSEQLADVAATAQALVPALEALDGPRAADHVEMRGGYDVAADRLAFLRLREIVYHHVDLDAGFTFDDVEPALLRQFAGDAIGRLEQGSRPPSATLLADTGDTWTVGDGATTVSGTLGGLVLWLARRDQTGVTSDTGDVPSLPRGA